MAAKWIGVLSGVDEVINRHISHDGYTFRHGKVGKALTARPRGFSASALVSDLIKTIEGNIRTHICPVDFITKSSGYRRGHLENAIRHRKPAYPVALSQTY